MHEPASLTRLARPLAAAFLGGSWTEPAMTRRARETLAPAPRWIRRLTALVLEHYHRPPLDRPRELERFVAEAMRMLPQTPLPRGPEVRRRFVFEERMGRRRWPVPEIDTVAGLAELLELDAGRLDWLADARGLERRVEDERLRNYRYDWIARGPGRPQRLIERPKPLLKAAQRRVLRELLMLIPVHEACHGFVPGRSARGHAAAHAGSGAVLRFDLEDFFASIRAGRCYGIFRGAGYAEGVAHALTALCTNTVPSGEWAARARPRGSEPIAAHWRLGSLLATPHLPQGAPTSPALANLAAFALDRRLSGLAARLGARYTRYADDLVLSGPRALAGRADGVSERVAEIAADEGFRLNERKTRVCAGLPGSSSVASSWNEHPNVPRADYDRLKAILHNSARNGAAAENRGELHDFRAHLLGRIAWVEQLNPGRGARLRERFAEIDW